MIVDESCELSRSHCTISLRDGGAVLKDTSSNGVFVGSDRKRAPRDSEVPLSAYETLHVGQFLIVVEPREHAPANDTTAFTALFQTIIPAEALRVRSDWDVEHEPNPGSDHHPATDAALLDSFCAGAGLDASSFMGEDPAMVMQRAGAIYKQMVLGLGDLLSERHIVRSDLNMDRTTVGASGNNPFKWAPTRRVAIDLLREREDGFLSGATALKASFEDLKKHSLCLMAGSRASVDHVLRTLAPQMIENQITAHGLLRPNKFESCWRAYQNGHAHLADEEPSGAQSSVNRAFKAGYERRLRDLDEGSTKS
jgi:predicted component of type VI protein secretion system